MLFFFIGRQTLLSTHWNLLSAMLSGRWDKHLLKDSKGRIFLDYDSEWLSPILNLIRESTISLTSTDELVLPPVKDEKQEGFDSIISFFGLDPKRVVSVPRPYAFVPPSLVSLSQSTPPPAVIMSPTRDVLSQWIITALSIDGTDTTTTTWESSLHTLNWDLIYKGSRDGFTVADIQSKCNSKCNTVVIVTDTVGNVFGGFVEVPLIDKAKAERRQQGQQGVSQNGFLFSLYSASNALAKPVKASLKHNTHGQAVFYSNSDLFSFGHCHDKDFCLLPSMAGTINVDNVLQQRGRTYAMDAGSDGSHTIFNDVTQFAAIEVEVYTVEKGIEEPPSYESEINRYAISLLYYTFYHNFSLTPSYTFPS